MDRMKRAALAAVIAAVCAGGCASLERREAYAECLREHRDMPWSGRMIAAECADRTRGL